MSKRDKYKNCYLYFKSFQLTDFLILMKKIKKSCLDLKGCHKLNKHNDAS